MFAFSPIVFRSDSGLVDFCDDQAMLTSTAPSFQSDSNSVVSVTPNPPSWCTGLCFNPTRDRRFL